YGDIFVAGYPGASAGADGHTGFILNEQDDTIIHMSYTPNSVSITPRKGYMGDGRGLPVRYYRLVGGTNNETYKYKK
ncbi:MAG: cell wall-binding protein, partial [Anaerococcus sp.]|nr:cell wall-binding protein [Anaerococcus sp.]